jgi:NAD(P)-dependent dehydrogenase (short-subunit alcohol dehydrogenase family)
MSSESEVAVVTGGASGIGLGIAEEAGRRGMTVILLDLDERPLAEAEQAFKDRQVRVEARRLDVTDGAAVEAIDQDLFDRHGRVDYLFNNAGVLVAGQTWERSVDEYRWIFEVNVMGVVNGIRAFVPRMIKANRPAWVVNTASLGGLRAAPMVGPYCASKFAVVGLTESMEYEFQSMGLPLKGAVLCPGEVQSGIYKSERVRPDKFAAQGASLDDKAQAFLDRLNTNNETATTGEAVGRYVFQALDENRFYLLPHPEWMSRVRHRLDIMFEGGRPQMV